MQAAPTNNMEYRYLGNSGLRVSVLAYGTWLNQHTSDEAVYELTRDSIKQCFEAGINFFDTAEIYAEGCAETLMGRAFKDLNYRREELVISTKLWSVGKGVNDKMLSRKHLVEGLKNSLKRLQMDYVDIVYCHRPDFDTPLEETCKAMHQLIEDGLSFYWGTSMWQNDIISRAIEICDRLGLHKPITEQSAYSMIRRDIVEKDYRRINEHYKYGNTIWSPLQGGILTGKYNDGNIPEGSRYDIHSGFLKSSWESVFGADKKDVMVKKLGALADYAKELGYTQTQLALAWCVANTDVSTVILGFTRLTQIDENLKCMELYKKWTPEIEAKCNEILSNTPEFDMNWQTW